MALQSLQARPLRIIAADLPKLRISGEEFRLRGIPDTVTELEMMFITPVRGAAMN